MITLLNYTSLVLVNLPKIQQIKLKNYVEGVTSTLQKSEIIGI